MYLDQFNFLRFSLSLSLLIGSMNFFQPGLSVRILWGEHVSLSLINHIFCLLLSYYCDKMKRLKKGISQPRKSLFSPYPAPPHSFRRSLFQKGCSVQSILVFSIQHSFIITGANNIIVYIHYYAS